MCRGITIDHVTVQVFHASRGVRGDRRPTQGDHGVRQRGGQIGDGGRRNDVIQGSEDDLTIGRIFIVVHDDAVDIDIIFDAPIVIGGDDGVGGEVLECETGRRDGVIKGVGRRQAAAHHRLGAARADDAAAVEPGDGAVLYGWRGMAERDSVGADRCDGHMANGRQRGAVAGDSGGGVGDLTVFENTSGRIVLELDTAPVGSVRTGFVGSENDRILSGSLRQEDPIDLHRDDR